MSSDSTAWLQHSKCSHMYKVAKMDTQSVSLDDTQRRLLQDEDEATFFLEETTTAKLFWGFKGCRLLNFDSKCKTE